MNYPQRIQIEANNQSELQQLSYEINGLSAVYVGSGSKWEDPYRISPSNIDGVAYWILHHTTDVIPKELSRPNPTLFGKVFLIRELEEALEKHQRFYEKYIEKRIREKLLNIDELSEKNLACNCSIYKQCHANILLRLAN